MPSKERRVGGVESHLLLMAADLQAVGLSVDHEEAEALVWVLARAGGDDVLARVRAVGDEDLGAVDDVVVALTACARLQAGQVGAGAGLRHREGAQLVAACERRKELLLLVRRRGPQDGRGRDAGVHGHGDARRRAAVGDLLEPQAVGDLVDPGAAVLGRDQGAQEAQWLEFFQDL
jgi:hypothetical protein